MADEKPKVLDVGQCVPDHFGIRAVLTEHFDATVEQAHTIDEAVDAVRSGGYDLVLVNRKLDATYEAGADLIRRLQADETTRAVPIMLVSNYPDAQAEATKLGARPGFGKAALRDNTTIERIAACLRR